MKQLRVLIPVMLFVLSLSVVPRLSAQTDLALATAPRLSAQPDLTLVTPTTDYFSHKKKKKSKSSLKDHLWYGGGVSLGFAGTSGASVFGIGVSPMVGYKIVGPLSAGPRVSVMFTSEKYAGFKAFNLLDLEFNLFARVRVYKGLFVQGELGTVADQQIVADNLGQPVKRTQTRPAQYVGLGYNFTNGQGGPGQEISVMYDFYIANDLYGQQTPFQFRIAFTFGY